MILVPNRAIVRGIGAVWGHNVRQFVSPNDLHTQYFYSLLT